MPSMPGDRSLREAAQGKSDAHPGRRLSRVRGRCPSGVVWVDIGVGRGLGVVFALGSGQASLGRAVLGTSDVGPAIKAGGLLLVSVRKQTAKDRPSRHNGVGSPTRPSSTGRQGACRAPSTTTVDISRRPERNSFCQPASMVTSAGLIELRAAPEGPRDAQLVGCRRQRQGYRQQAAYFWYSQVGKERLRAPFCSSAL